MIDAAVSAGLERIAARERDVLGAYQPGFTPEAGDAAGRSRIVAAPDPLSVAAPEGTYFAVAADDGALRFTRDGGFALVNGALVDRAGRPVLGFANDDRSRIVPLRADPYDAALGRIGTPSLDADGSLVYVRRAVDPRTGEVRTERVVAGRVALARFPAATRPARADATGFVAPPHVAPRFGPPASAAFAPLHVRARDLGRMDVLTGLERVHDAYDAFEALRAANHARGSCEKTTMDLLK